MQEVIEACRGVPLQSFAAGDILIREGDSGGRLYVLAEGEVAVVKGMEQVARTRNAGALFGEMAVLLGRPYSATVMAVAPSRLYVIDDAEAFLTASPDVTLHAARLLAQRLHDATTYLADVKAQFRDQGQHLGMLDRILDSLLNQQHAVAALPPSAGSDSRL